VLQALQKAPERRYPSADALAADIRRHLGGLPVSARGDHLRYRAWQFVRRHRTSVAAAALVVLSLVAGLVGTVWQARRAEAEARKASAAKDFLKSLFAASEPANAQGRALTAKELLDDGARRIETELAGQPDVRSEVRRLIASVYVQLGGYEQARPLLSAELEEQRRRAGPRSIAAAEALAELGDAVWYQDHYDEARALYAEALGIQRERRGPRAAQTAVLLGSLGRVDRERGDLAGAEDQLRQALAILEESGGEDSEGATGVRESLAVTCYMRDRQADAAALQAAVSRWRARRLGADHPGTLVSRFNEAHYLLGVGRSAEAIPILEDVEARQRRILGPRHDSVASSLRMLAIGLDAAGRSEEARTRASEALAVHREALGDGNVQVLLDLIALGGTEAQTGRLAEAVHTCREAIAFLGAHPGLGARTEAIARSGCGGVLLQAGRLEEAEAQLTAAVARFRAAGTTGAFPARALDALGDVMRRTDRVARAVPLSQEAIAILERTAPEHPKLALYRVHAGAALWASGRRADGERLLREGVGAMERAFPAGHPDLAEGRFLLGDALSAREGRVFLLRALEWRRSHLGPADPRTVAVQKALARTASSTVAVRFGDRLP
jgi:tetratricopeptide (TPR) repeat protein